MGQVMLAAVFGAGNAPDGLVTDIQELFAEVNARTAIFGSRKSARRDAFRGDLQRLWNQAPANGKTGFLALAHTAAHGLASEFRSEDFLLDQIPHWMFTFTNSGSDLLLRSLALILARPTSLDRARQEVTSPRLPAGTENSRVLSYLGACIREAARLFPPVALTTHRAAQDLVFDGKEIAAGTEILQYFPFTNRDVAADPYANHYRPERWLDSGDPIHLRTVNTFLSGARACPGQDIILCLLEFAISQLLRDGGMQAKPSRLSDDPLPYSFTIPYFPF
jgi:cytochrome P450